MNKEKGLQSEGREGNTQGGTQTQGATGGRQPDPALLDERVSLEEEGLADQEQAFKEAQTERD